MRRENGSVIGVNNTPTTSVASGVWSLFEQARYQKEGVWPTFVAGEPYFKNTTLLLHGDGTNGAQNNTFLDSSTNAFTITRNGNTTQGTFSPFSQTGWSNYFDGSGDYLSVADNAALNLGTGDFTIECWVYPLTVNAANANPLINKLNGSSNNGWLLGMSNGSLWQFSTGSAVIVRSGSVSLNTWTHLAAVRSSGTTTLYVNGTSVGSTATSYNFTDSVALLIGDNASFVAANAYISNARVVKGTAVYTSAFTPPTTPLTAISGTSLLTCQSNRFRDASTNNFAITVNGNTSVQAFSPFAPTAAYSAATVGGSGYFDGSGDYLTVSSSSPTDLGTGQFTIECFIYPTATNQPQYIISNYANSSTGFTLGYRGTDKTFTFNATGDAADITSNASFPPYQWHHVAISGQNGGLAMFVNGVKQGSTFTGSTAFTSGVAANIGDGAGAAGGQRVFGYIGGLRVVKGSQVYDPASSTITVPTAPLTAVTNTSLLLNFTNGGIIDNTAKNDLETVGNAQISTSVKKYGTGSLAFDGTGDDLSIRYGQNFNLGSGDFTLECWANISYVQYSAIISSTSTSISTGMWLLGFSNTANQMAFAIDSGGNAIVGADYTSYAGSWTHIAVSRSGTTLRLFFNGTQVASVTNSTNFTGDTANPVVMGRRYTNIAQYYINGYIDDLRITKGVARYTANFTAPTAAFEDQ